MINLLAKTRHPRAPEYSAPVKTCDHASRDRRCSRVAAIRRLSRLYLVGEAPGRQEAEIGRPFVGPVGGALRDMMREAGMDASRVRLALTSSLAVRSSGHGAASFATGGRPRRNSRAYGGSVLVLLSQ